MSRQSMQPDTTVSPAVAVAPSDTITADVPPKAPVQDGDDAPPPARFPPPKTDKPRPHVCGTCARSFARLEHLKRHERSHTKEKPFECPECTRCFARRDLLLRHQQKLHMTNSATSRPRNGRRESVGGASVAGSRVRKNSMANTPAGAPTAQARPRANTISHVDLSTLGLADGPYPALNRMNALGLAGPPMGFDYRGMSTAIGDHGNAHALPKLNTHYSANPDLSNSLRTAPPHATFAGFDIDQLFGPGTTVNPAQLHFGGSLSATQPHAPPQDPFAVQLPIDSAVQGDDFGWMRSWNMHMPFDRNELAIEESSPSRLSSDDSPPDFSDSMTASNPALIPPNAFQWPQRNDPSRLSTSSAAFHLDVLGSGLPELDLSAPQDTVSPNMLDDPTPRGDHYFHQAMMQQHQQQQQQHILPHDQAMPDAMQPPQGNGFAAALSTFSSDSPSIMSSLSMGGSARQSSVTSASTSSITEATRQALLVGLSQPSGVAYGTRRVSQPVVSSPLSPSVGRNGSPGASLPSTADIRRYIDAFIQCAHPHMPVTHIPTLSFDPADISANIGSPSPGSQVLTGLMAGGGLILGMAAIGALYELEHTVSQELFEAAKKLIGVYLEERRKTGMSAVVNGSGADGEQQTPLWLVQAMMLTVIYGHMCGDKTSADIASNHCAALVSLARAAELAQPPLNVPPASQAQRRAPRQPFSMDVDGSDDSIGPGDSVSRFPSQDMDLHAQWIAWKTAEERKRTLFAIFILSSLLVTAYNQNPTIMNSEIMLDLPCDEELWAAETAQKWQERGGLVAAEQDSVSFASALSTLLTASKRKSKGASRGRNGSLLRGEPQDGDGLAGELRPSTFGCLVLIFALHNYIWETRSRHNGWKWTAQETESMFSHIEPALNAWQAAWKANDRHRLERPNPFGPLGGDSIPLLDLAFVRLFVNLGRSKECFWQRDFDGMAHEMACGAEIVQHASGASSEDETGKVVDARRASMSQPREQASSRRERHLRKAAFYAADSLTMACRYNLTYADMATSHELPIQSAICFFDCAQVLAEWACTVQERVGRYLGVLGRDAVDLTAVPGVVLLEGEDIELLGKIGAICESLEQKRFAHDHLLNVEDLQQTMAGSAAMLATCGYGPKLLRISSMMLDKAVVWPITQVMAKALQTQAAHMDQRAASSIVC